MSACVTSLCNKIDVHTTIEQAARSCVEIVCEMEILTGRNPNTIAGACLYLIAKQWHEPLDLKEVATAAGLAETTIKETYKRINPYRLEIIPKWYVLETIEHKKKTKNH